MLGDVLINVVVLPTLFFHAVSHLTLVAILTEPLLAVVPTECRFVVLGLGDVHDLGFGRLEALLLLLQKTYLLANLVLLGLPLSQLQFLDLGLEFAESFLLFCLVLCCDLLLLLLILLLLPAEEVHM